MAEERFEERTESATPRRRQEARERGHVSKSIELSSAVILLAGVIALNVFGPQLVGGLKTLMIDVLGNLQDYDFTADNARTYFVAFGYVAGMAIMPVVVTIVVFALSINIVQVGFIFTGATLTFDLSKLNPVSGFQRMFSMRGFVRLTMGLFKVAVVGGILYWTMWGERYNILAVLDKDFTEIVKYMVEIIFLLSMRAALALLLLALFDFGYQRWQYEKDIMMSKQEVKEEYKRLEGDPKIRERRRAIQRQLALQRMMQKVPKATVVITNPTEVAIAIQYKEGMDAPIVVAKGMGFIAQRIRDIAGEHGIPIVERPPLARMLYKIVEVGGQIPYDLYKAVAEVLSYVYQLKGRKVAV